jgi:hypothetical protein
MTDEGIIGMIDSGMSMLSAHKWNTHRVSGMVVVAQEASDMSPHQAEGHECSSHHDRAGSAAGKNCGIGEDHNEAVLQWVPL